MKGTIKLTNPILIDNVETAELSYDTNEITAAMFVEADTRKMAASTHKAGNTAGAAEIDYDLHIYLGFMSIVAVNPKIDVSDLERIHGSDVVSVMRLGRSFFSTKSAAASSPDSSDASPEATREPSTPPSETSSESD
ncbi:MAG: early nodulin 20 (N-20) [Clostridiaceae bacterium]|nr:early nodulin 20 (N-20) [Clostridiaceae bacterium]DAM37343.1 MAG TPA: hypothetical protein [Caudoviricetes sp.]